MKSLNQMDLDEWELLPDEGFLEINEDGGKKIYSRKYLQSSESSVFQMNHFICPPKPNPQFVEKTVHPRMPNQLLPLPVNLDPTNLKPDGDDDRERVVKEVTKIPIEIKSFGGTGLPTVDQDPISQVFFKKMKETEFVDMKMDSPKSCSSPSRGIMPFQMEEKGDDRKEGKVDSEMAIDNSGEMELDMEEGEEGGVNVWKWSLSGIGAICSFGVAAATFCIVVFSHQKNKHHRKNQKLQFQIYSNDKRVKQVIEQASKLNDTIAAMRGVSMSRAQITYGGYYDASL